MVAIVGAIVFLEGVLREAVERERGNVQVRSGDAPHAL